MTTSLVPSCLHWTATEVADWIETLGFPQYKECFTTNYITGRKLIWVNGSTLPTIGITDWKHIQLITEKVRELLHVEPPFWNRAITKPYRCEMGIFLERKSQSGPRSDRLKFKPSPNSTASNSTCNSTNNSTNVSPKVAK